MINSPRVNLFTGDNVQRIFYIVNKNVQRKMNSSSKEWKQEVFKRILAAYRAGNANVLARLLKEKFNVERSTVYAWRDGRSKPTEELLKKISKDTGEPFVWFLTGNYEQDIVSTETNLSTDEENKESIFTYADFARFWSKYDKLTDQKVKKGISSSLEIMEGFIDQQLVNQKLYKQK